MRFTTSDRMPIIGWNMNDFHGPVWVEDFLETVYGLIYSAESANQFVDEVRWMLDESERVSDDPVAVQRERRTFERASERLVASMTAEGVKVSELMPAFVRAAVIEGSEKQIKRSEHLLGIREERLGALWGRLASAAIPAARRAAATALYSLAIAEHAKREKVKIDAPLSKSEAVALMSTASAVMGFDWTAINQSHRFVLKSGRMAIDAFAGALVHVKALSFGSMTVTTMLRPEYSIRVKHHRSDPSTVEVTAPLADIEGGPTAAKQRAALRALGFTAPSRRRDDHTWHQSSTELATIELSVLIANVLEQVMGLRRGDAIQMKTVGLVPRGPRRG